MERKKAKWKKTNFSGVSTTSESRLHGVIPDKYLRSASRRAASGAGGGIGWASKGWTAEKAAVETR